MANADKKLKEAVDGSRWEDVLAALESGANPNTKAPNAGYVLPHACWYRKLDVVRELLARGADANINKGEPLERTAHKSSNGDARPILQLLLDHGVKLDFQYPRRQNKTALSIAIETGNLQVAEMLVKAKADLTIKDNDGCTPLQLAKDWGHRKLVELMTRKPTKGKRAAIDPFVDVTYIGRIAKSRAPHTSGVPDWRKVFKGKHYPGCANPPVHLLTIDLSLIPEFPTSLRRLGKMPIVSHACSCDERDYYELAIGRDRRLSDTDTWNDRHECERADYRGSKKATPIQLTRKTDPSRGDVGIYVGGQPRWAQSPIWPSCSRCDEASFFVATLYQYELPPSAPGAGNTLNVFACGTCRTQCVIRQST